MILLFTLYCPNDHAVFATPQEYPGSEPPPLLWLLNMQREIMRPVKASTTQYQTCQFCGAPRSEFWHMHTLISPAATMEEAEQLLTRQTDYNHLLDDDGEEAERVNTNPLDPVN